MKYGYFVMPMLFSALAALAPMSLPAAPWDLLIPFRRVDADPNKQYVLTEDHGPWMILASSFAGEGAEKQARDLVLELRQQYNLHAFVHKQTYDFTEPVRGLGLDRYGHAKKMRFATAAKFDEIAVLVGHFDSVEDPKIEKTLSKIRFATPATLSVSRTKGSTQRFIGLREWQRRLSSDEDKRKRGPMGNAFVTRNPLLPESYFRPGGIDPLVIAMNRDLEFSLLNNPGRYSVRIATFRGASTMNLDIIKRDGKGLPSKLEEAALRAHELTLALRRQRVEAYEFHDRHESIVTIGSFDELGQHRADGKTDLDPGIVAIMKRYSPRQERLPGQPDTGLMPVTINGIPCDIQPIPVEVPRKSIAAAYAAGNRLYD
jgi:hypothetical protein